MKRRSLLKLAAGSAVLALVPSQPLLASTPHKRMAMVVDVRRCTGCMACTVSCSIENNVEKGRGRTQVIQYIESRSGQSKTVALASQCAHCEHPKCVEACPDKVQATYKRESDGVVVIDHGKCISCQRCVKACPYGARKRGKAMKTPPQSCNLCVHRLDQGLLPACVETCVGEARTVGDLNDPASAVHQLVKQHRVYTLLSQHNTSPNLYYIGLPEQFADQAVLSMAPLNWQR